jgi:hypothetical protein
MADVVNIADFRKKPPPMSPQDIVSFSVEHVMGEWERFAKANKLSDFFNSSIGASAKPFVNYLTNLTEIGNLEQQLGVMAGIWAPGINGPAQLGWRACFRFGEILVETPDMAFEPHARCCNILIFMKIKREVIAAARGS